MSGYTYLISCNVYVGDTKENLSWFILQQTALETSKVWIQLQQFLCCHMSWVITIFRLIKAIIPIPETHKKYNNNLLFTEQVHFLM